MIERERHLVAIYENQKGLGETVKMLREKDQRDREQMKILQRTTKNETIVSETAIKPLVSHKKMKVRCQDVNANETPNKSTDNTNQNTPSQKRHSETPDKLPVKKVKTGITGNLKGKSTEVTLKFQKPRSAQPGQTVIVVKALGPQSTQEHTSTGDSALKVSKSITKIPISLGYGNKKASKKGSEGVKGVRHVMGTSVLVPSKSPAGVNVVSPGSPNSSVYGSVIRPVNTGSRTAQVPLLPKVVPLTSTRNLQQILLPRGSTSLLVKSRQVRGQQGMTPTSSVCISVRCSVFIPSYSCTNCISYQT